MSKLSPRKVVHLLCGVEDCLEDHEHKILMSGLRICRSMVNKQ